MASIRLEQVTKIYNPSPILGNFLTRRVLPSSKNRSEPRSENENVDENVLALDNVDFKIPNGQTTAVVGPSGCGKSTLLRAIAGLIDYKGHIYYDNQNMNDVPVKERRIGMVFQNYALYPHFHGRGNLSFYFKVNKAPDVEAEERIRITSEVMGIGFNELLKRKPGTLSGGQQQRVAIGRAIVRKPELFLFDEPLSNLDAKLRTRTRVEIKRLLHRFNITAIYVTHDQSEAMALGDEIAVMRDGRIEQVAAFHHIISNPVNQFVAGFLGLPPMNLLEGVIQDGDLNIDGLIIRLPQSVKKLINQGQTVTMGIRPERISIGIPPDEGNSTDFVHIPSTAEILEPDFGRRLYIAYLRHNNLTYCATAPLDSQIHAGYTCDAYLPISAIFLFDKESGSFISKCDSN